MFDTCSHTGRPLFSCLTPCFPLVSLLAYSLASIFIRSTFLSNCPSPTSTVEITLRIKLLLTLLQMKLAPLGKDCKLSVLWQNLCARAVELEVGENGKLLSE